MTLKEKFNELAEQHKKQFARPHSELPEEGIWRKARHADECLEQSPEEQDEHYASLLLSLSDRQCDIIKDFMGGNLLIAFRPPKLDDLRTRLRQELGRDRDEDGEFISNEKIESWAEEHGIPTKEAFKEAKRAFKERLKNLIKERPKNHEFIKITEARIDENIVAGLRWQAWSEAFEHKFEQRLSELNASAPYGDLYTTLRNRIRDAVRLVWVQTWLEPLSQALDGKEYVDKQSHLFYQPGEKPFGYTDGDLERGFTNVDGRKRTIDHVIISAGGIQYSHEYVAGEFDFSQLPTNYDSVISLWREAARVYKQNKHLSMWQDMVKKVFEPSVSQPADELINRLDETDPVPTWYTDEKNGKTTWRQPANIALEHAARICEVSPYARSIATLRNELQKWRRKRV